MNETSSQNLFNFVLTFTSSTLEGSKRCQMTCGSSVCTGGQAAGEMPPTRTWEDGSIRVAGVCEVGLPGVLPWGVVGGGLSVQRPRVRGQGCITAFFKLITPLLREDHKEWGAEQGGKVGGVLPWCLECLRTVAPAWQGEGQPSGRLHPQTW